MTTWKRDIQNAIIVYNGDIESRVTIHQLTSLRGIAVTAFIPDLGQNTNLEDLGEEAIVAGANSAHIADLKKTFVNDYVSLLVKSGVLFYRHYPLGKALGAPCLLEELVKIAGENSIQALALPAFMHPREKKRIENYLRHYGNHLEIITPPEKPYSHQEELLSYANVYGLNGENFQIVYQLQDNVLSAAFTANHVSREKARNLRYYFWNLPPDKAPGDPLEIALEFKKGMPYKINGKPYRIERLIDFLNITGGKYCLGRSESTTETENGQINYRMHEAPGAYIVDVARRHLEDKLLDPDSLETRDVLANKYARLLIEGGWYESLRSSIDAFFDRMSSGIEGKVSLCLNKGFIRPACEMCVDTHSVSDRQSASILAKGEDF